MALKEHVYSVLVVSSSDKFNSSLAAFLPESVYSPVKVVESVNAAKRAVLERYYDFVLVNTPLPDEFGTRFAIDVCNERGMISLMFVKGDLYEEIHAKVVDYGVYLLPKPSTSAMLARALNWMSATRERLRRLERKTVTIEEKMNEIRIINRAKWLLIDVLKMTESDAHHFIEKQAMDNCKSKKEIAENIIRTYS